MKAHDGANTTTWSMTNLELAQAFCPHETQTHWQRARYKLAAYDWIGHERNLAKQAPFLLPEDRAQAAKCKLCGCLDS